MKSLTIASLFLSCLAVVSAQSTGGEGSGVSAGQNNANYNCPSSCVAPNCICASQSIPGGLSKDQTPMFVTLTFDDAIQSMNFPGWRAWVNSTVNRNGCPIPATFFVSNAYSDYALITQTYNEGHEIAVHTVNHINMTDPANAGILASEITASRDATAAFGGVPKNKLMGFRHPYLSLNKGTYDTVFANGFTYESSITLDPTTQAWWPHTLDYGMPYDVQPCDGSCPPGPQMVYPGKWVIPMYNLLTTKGGLYASMDPPMQPNLPNSYQEALDNLKYSFNVHYEKKLPFGLYQHATQFIAWTQDPTDFTKKVAVMSEFVKWTLDTYKDVWYVTNQQLIDWIKAPVATNKMMEKIPCVAPAVAKGNQEICDGIDNDNDGTIDNGLQVTCQIGDASFKSCFGCPSQVPNRTLAVPPTNGNRVRVPDAGCSGTQSWDPVGGQCVQLTRPSLQARDATGGSGGGGSSSATVPSSGVAVMMMGGWMIAGLLSVVLY